MLAHEQIRIIFMASRLSKTKFRTCVKGYHVYQNDWIPALGEVLTSLLAALIAVTGTSRDSGPFGDCNGEFLLKPYLNKLICFVLSTKNI